MTSHPRKRSGFRSKALQKKKEPHAFHYLSQRASFWIAIISVFAFVTGNMIGQHGLYAFLHSVMGGFDDSLIVYDGTVSPIERVPDFTRWSLYGGDAGVHTFRQVPADLLVPMPKYVPHDIRPASDKLANNIYSVDHFGTYTTGGGEGSHPGIDIRLPEGTPIRSIMNGHVSAVGEDRGGFGKYILVRHPRVPDPDDSTKTTTLYTLFAHLSAQLVSEGDVVHKAQVIGASGMTGNASGPHLHFQMQREACKDDGTVIGPHTFWPYNTADLKAAGMSFYEAINEGLNRDHGMQCTANPLLYVQANYAALEKPLIVMDTRSSSSRSVRARKTASELLAERVAARKARLAVAKPVTVTMLDSSASASSAATAQSSSLAGVVEVQTIAYAEPVTASVQAPSNAGKVTSVDIRIDRSFSNRKWSKLIITLLDENGHTVTSPTLDQDLALRTAYGRAEFKPSTLTSLDFKNGEAEVQILPLGQQTVVVQIQPLNVLSAPMKLSKE